MPNRDSWDWQDYEMEHRPIITSEDYTIQAFGRDEEINSFIRDSVGHSKQSTRMLYKLVDYWGTGKSTFLYNICYQVNEKLFFEDGAEDPASGQYSHVLAFYEETPKKRSNLLQRVYDFGLPVTWTPTRTKTTAEELRVQNWHSSLRKLSFLYLRRAASVISKKMLDEAATAGSSGRLSVLEKIISYRALKTGDFIKKLDEEQEQNEQFFEDAGELMRFYSKMILPSMEVRRGNVKIVSQELFEQQFPKFLYNENSNEHLLAYNSLFANQDRNLRYFQSFEKLLKATGTQMIIVFDEVEDWASVVKDKIDRDIHDMVVDAESPISLIMVFRTEVLRNISSNSALGVYMTIYDRLHNLAMRQLTFDNVKKLTAGVLSTARAGKESTFPLSDEFIQALVERTKRTKAFNARSYLTALDGILERSQSWPRSSPELSADLLDRDDAQQLISNTLRSEEQSAGLIKTLPERGEE